MEQALVNLCMNAVQAIEEAPTVDLVGEICVQAQLTNGPETMLQISVSDNGPGIPAEIEEQIFDPFFSTKDSGTGLGLSVVQRIVDDHSGTIHAESRQSGPPNSGTIFTISLPSTPLTIQQSFDH